MSKELFKSVTANIRLYKQPKRIGETITVEKKTFLIIAIQNIKIRTQSIYITYVCQDLETNFVPQLQRNDPSDTNREFYMIFPTGKIADALKKVELGKLFFDKEYGLPYQTTEYTDIEFMHTDVKVSFLARPIRPISQKEAKAKWREEKKRSMKLEVL